MNTTAVLLKKIISLVPDDTIIAGLDYRNKVMTFDHLKRILLLEKDGEQILLFNSMGTHYFDLVEKDGYKVVRHWDDEKELSQFTPVIGESGEEESQDGLQKILEYCNEKINTYKDFDEMKTNNTRYWAGSVSALNNIKVYVQQLIKEPLPIRKSQQREEEKIQKAIEFCDEQLKCRHIYRRSPSFEYNKMKSFLKELK